MGLLKSLKILAQESEKDGESLYVRHVPHRHAGSGCLSRVGGRRGGGGGARGGGLPSGQCIAQMAGDKSGECAE